MILTGVTREMLKRAIEDCGMLKGHDVPPGAVETMTRAVFEYECADWVNDQEWWDKLGAGERRGRLEIGAWFLGRLAIAGYEVREAGKRAWWHRLWAWGQEPFP